MAIPSFFKQNKPRGFNYMPRYYDPQKEEREERLRAIGMEQARSEATQSRVGGRAESMEQARSEATQSRVSGRAESMEQGAKGMEQPYRSKILRGDMKNYFPRNMERIERHSRIRLLVIIMIMVLAIYIYLRFF